MAFVADLTQGQVESFYAAADLRPLAENLLRTATPCFGHDSGRFDGAAVYIYLPENFANLTAPRYEHSRREAFGYNLFRAANECQPELKSLLEGERETVAQLQAPVAQKQVRQTLERCLTEDAARERRYTVSVARAWEMGAEATGGESGEGVNVAGKLNEWRRKNQSEKKLQLQLQLKTATVLQGNLYTRLQQSGSASKAITQRSLSLYQAFDAGIGSPLSFGAEVRGGVSLSHSPAFKPMSGPKDTAGTTAYPFVSLGAFIGYTCELARRQIGTSLRYTVPWSIGAGEVLEGSSSRGGYWGKGILLQKPMTLTLSLSVTF